MKKIDPHENFKKRNALMTVLRNHLEHDHGVYTELPVGGGLRGAETRTYQQIWAEYIIIHNSLPHADMSGVPITQRGPYHGYDEAHDYGWKI